jgi:nucleoside phosphorylase
MYTVGVVDVLIVAALPEESDAARDVALTSGMSKWEEVDTDTPFEYFLGRYVAGHFAISIALWRSTRMGGLSVGSVVGALVERLKPSCLAMCGVCAGNPGDVALGDVVIARVIAATL